MIVCVDIGIVVVRVLVLLEELLARVVSFSVFDFDPVLPLDLHVSHYIWTSLLTPLNLFKLRMHLLTLLNKLLHFLLGLKLIDSLLSLLGRYRF